MCYHTIPKQPGNGFGSRFPGCLLVGEYFCEHRQVFAVHFAVNQYLKKFLITRRHFFSTLYFYILVVVEIFATVKEYLSPVPYEHP